MQGRTHLTTGVAVGAWYAAALPAPDLVRITCAALLAAATLLPDLDHKHAVLTRWWPTITRPIHWIIAWRTPHRGATHLARAAAYAGAPCALAALAVPDPVRSWWWAYGLAVTIGWLTHLAADARTNSGLPRTRRPGRLHIGRRLIRVGSPAETRWRRRWQRIAVASVAAALFLTAVTVTPF